MPALRIIKRPPPPPTLQALANLPPLPAAKPEGLFASALNQNSISHHRLGKYTKSDFSIHVSDLMQSAKERVFCAREHAINFHEARGEEMVRRITPAMALLHHMGHGVQDHLTRQFMARSPFGHTLWGNWKCSCGVTTAKHSLKPDYCCQECKTPVDHYVEVTIRQPKYKLVGHPDIIILWNGHLCVYEVKSIDRAALPFDNITEPLGDHTLQATFYYWIMLDMHQRGELPFPPHDILNYLYVDRSNTKLFFGEPYKEFAKRRSESSRLRPMLARAEALIQSLENNTLPARICEEATCSRGKNCSVQVSCFNRKNNVIERRNSRRRA